MELNLCLETYFKSQNLFFFFPWSSTYLSVNICYYTFSWANFSGLILLILENGISRSTIQGTYHFSESYTTLLVLDLSLDFFAEPQKD